ncbi:MAG TPA: hypothetical protein VHB25_10475 [Gemmatimonadaceae bacterium]|nr:hypothetical protein [Gemmatimonadaceae bacterium]
MATRAAPDPESRGAAALDSLWLETLRRIVDRSAHEVKGALNGVALNVEVVRSRAERPETAASALAKYANATSTQLEAVIAMTEALLALGRGARAPVELASLVRQMAALLGPAVRSDGRSFELGALDDLGVTPAMPDAVRLAVGAGLLSACARAARVACGSTGGANPALRIECAGEFAAVASEVVDAAAEAGVRISSDAGGIVISFPR